MGETTHYGNTEKHDEMQVDNSAGVSGVIEQEEAEEDEEEQQPAGSAHQNESPLLKGAVAQVVFQNALKSCVPYTIVHSLYLR